MKLCMIGARGHYNYVLRSLEHLDQVQITGISGGTPGADAGSLTKWCADHGHAAEVFDDYRDMLDTIKPDIACVCGPFELHAEMCIEAFNRNIHVFCEKPVALTLEDLDRIKAAHANSNTHFAGMMGLRYDPAFNTAWRAVQAGAVGEVRLLSARKSYRLGTRDGYYKDRRTYGGTIPWVGSHAIDWISWFSGQSFQSAYATHTTSCNRDHGDLEMSAMCHFTLANDVFASASIDYLRPATSASHGDDRVRVAGTDGVIEVQGGKVCLVNGEADGDQMLEPVCDKQIFVDFVGHVEGTVTGLIGADDTLAVTEACLQARRSADEGILVNW